MNPTVQEEEQRFEALLARAERLRRGLPFAELRELAKLYRLHSARLAKLRTQRRDPEAIRYLNALCVRAYTQVYVAPSRRAGGSGFFSEELPQTLSRTWRLQLFVASLTLAGALVGNTLASQDRGLLPALVPMYPAEMLEELADSSEAQGRFLQRESRSVTHKTLFSAQLFLHNTRVGILAFVVGILAGFLTLLLVLFNGAVLGAFVSIFNGGPHSMEFWAWLLPHAVPELLAIVLCATAGLSLGVAVLAPGRAGRKLALRRAGRQALQLVMAAVPLLLAAGLIESFVRESMISTAARFAVMALAIATLVAYGVAIAFLARRTAAPDLSFLRAIPPDGSPDSD